MSARPLIAIVDDDASIRDTTRDLLESAGFAAEAFSNPLDFLTCGRPESFACLITDLRLPEMTGMELYLRLVIRGNAIPAVIVTAYADDRIRRRATEANVLAVLSKPFAADELLELVRRATRRGRRRSNR